jgi:hypothetical protein
MTFLDWLFETGSFTNPYKAGQWGLLHILTLLLCIAVIVGSYFIVKYSKNKAKTVKTIILILAITLTFFEVAQRVVYIVRRFYYNVPDMEGLTLFWILIPKPWCAVACWSVVAAVFVNKKFLYNFASMQGLLCTLIYFAYPGTGFNNEYIMFSNLYSIFTHALLLVMSVLFIVLKLTKFEYKNIWKELICFAVVFAYSFLEVFVFKTFADPMYFMPGGDIQANILAIDYGLYLVLYIVLLVVYINSFYLISDFKTVKDLFKKESN